MPTELISVLILHTGSVQQEQESSPPAKSLPVCKCPEAQEPGRHSQEDGRGGAHQTPVAARRPPVCGPEVWMLVEPQSSAGTSSALKAECTRRAPCMCDADTASARPCHCRETENRGSECGSESFSRVCLVNGAWVTALAFTATCEQGARGSRKPRPRGCELWPGSRPVPH